MAAPEAHPFWAFSIAVYERDGVAEACLALQERHDLDVNVLLFCCWAGSRGQSLDSDEIARLIETVSPWRDDVVRPLRDVRRWLKTQSLAPAATVEPLRERVKADELKAEAIQQWLLAQAVPIPDGAGEAAVTAANMTAYFAALGRAPAAGDLADLAAVLRGCWPDLRPLDAIRVLGS